MRTNAVQIGTCTIGGGNPVAVQSMCNTDTLDVEASVAQCKALAAAGCTLIRLTTQGLAQVEALAQIQRRLRAEGITNPLVADVHFNAQVAFAAAAVVQKVRINPGNFSKDPERAAGLLRQLIAVCKTHHTTLRIGVNHGSLSTHILETWGNGPGGMCEGAMEYLRICKEEHFDRVVVSLKSSNTRVMTDAYRALVTAMEAEGMHYPLHLGVTEAGNGRSARLKSAAALYTLLQEGIGDTLRVSLTENPVAEIVFGRKLVDYFTATRTGEHTGPMKDWDDLILDACYRWAPGLLNKTIDSSNLSLPFVQLPAAPITPWQPSPEELKEFCLDLLQATRCRFTKPEYVSCPGCGRTLYNLEETVARIQKATAHLKGFTIAVLGCIVNGPGEMADADYGYVGEGRNHITLYKGKTPVLRGVPQEEAVERLLALIESDRVMEKDRDTTK